MLFVAVFTRVFLVGVGIRYVGFERLVISSCFSGWIGMPSVSCHAVSTTLKVGGDKAVLSFPLGLLRRLYDVCFSPPSGAFP